MNSKSIRQFQAGDSIQNYFLIKSADCKTGSNNKFYLDLTLVDQTGEINGKIWDYNPEGEVQYASSMLIKVRGSVTEWQGKLQLKVDKIRPVTAADHVDVGDFVPSAPYRPEDMWQEVCLFIEKIGNADIRNIVTAITKEKYEKLLLYPAAKQNHHAIRSGLLYHILTMLRSGEQLCQVYTRLNKDLLFAGIILHDIEKITEMNASDLGIVSEYTVEGELLGHIIQGIKLIEQTAQRLQADPEISLLLQHMVLSHHYEPDYGSPKRPMIPEAEILHYLDLIDARMYDMNRVLDNQEPGTLSEKVWLLNSRRLYKAQFGHTAKEEQGPLTLDF